MKKLAWTAVALLTIAVTFLAMSGGHPMRQAIAMVKGPEAIAYREPRVEVALQPGPPQPKVPPGEAGIDPIALEQAMTYADARNSRALVVGLNGHIVYEKYWGGAGLDDAIDASEFSPILAALLLGTALQNGEVRSIDESLASYVPEMAGKPQGAVTFRQLLTGDSGFGAADGWPWPRSLASRYLVADDLGATLWDWPQDPSLQAGESPINVNADILTMALARPLKGPYERALSERLWSIMGAGPISFGIDGERSSMGHTRAGCCVRARISDWMRVGALLANHGVFEGNQFLPPDYAQLMVTRPRKDSPRAGFLRADGQFIARDLVWLGASGKQRLWIVPSLKLVILRAGGEPPETEGWDEAMIPDTIARGTRGWKSGGVIEGSDPAKYAPH